ncbi:hypothetical protein OH77DRAFT_71444 [Trametes cingulata]|nr:hypothetical protein OH77DRAFT_71444 [Trametes cingulata]
MYESDARYNSFLRRTRAEVDARLMAHTAAIKAREIRTQAELYVIQLLQKLDERAASRRQLAAQAITLVPVSSTLADSSPSPYLSDSGQSAFEALRADTLATFDAIEALSPPQLASESFLDATGRADLATVRTCIEALPDSPLLEKEGADITLQSAGSSSSSVPNLTYSSDDSRSSADDSEAVEAHLSPGFSSQPEGKALTFGEHAHTGLVLQEIE